MRTSVCRAFDGCFAERQLQEEEEVFLPDVVLFALIVFSQFYYVWYAIAVVFGKGRKQMPHETLSQTIYIAIEVPEESRQAAEGQRETQK